jgi:gas vesicle protein
MSDKSKILLAFAFGAAVGAVVAHFIESDKGEETIEELKKTAGKLREDIEANIEKGKEIIKDITSTAESLLENIKD